MNNSDIIIIGGGAAGMMAAYAISKTGKTVTVLEARNRLGGRIHTLADTVFTQPVEAGAEFIHGHLPLTLQLHQEANISYRETAGDRWRRKDGKLTKVEDFIEQGGLLFKQLDELKEDISIADFLNRYFAGQQYEDLRNSIRGFVEGYDAADINRASALALREEWEGEDEHQFRPVGGYGRMIAYLSEACRKNGCSIVLSSIVKQVNWKTGSVEIQTDRKEVYAAKKLIVTIPLNVLKAHFPSQGAISFHPAIDDKLQAIDLMGMGHVIKILLEFRTPVWKDAQVKQNTGADLTNAGWIFSGETVPTWWMQLPEQSNLLTGWIAGPKAEALADTPDKDILEQSIQSLATILSLSADTLKEQLSASQVCNWTTDPFARGAYAYNTVETFNARKILTSPVEGTLFFAGEALYEGPEMGTVEGALSSGKRVAEEVCLNRDF